MKVLLVQPPQGARFGVSQALLIEPLGLEMVGAALQAGGHDVSLIDLRLDRAGRLDAALDSLRPPAAGISCGLTTDVYTALITARRIKERRPGTFVFCGGHHASVIPGDLLFPGSPLDAVVIGEGELAAVALIDALERDDDPGRVPGVMTGESRRGGFRPRPPIENLDELPLPARELTRRYRHRYHHGFSAFSAAVETSRGCLFNGGGCEVRHRSPKRVVEDLKRVQALGGRNVLITDEIAFLDPDSYQRLGRRIGRAGLELAYACETRADLVVGNQDLFEVWKEAGATTVRLDYGDRSQEAIKVIRSARIEPMLSVIADPDWGDDEFASLGRGLDDSRLPNPAFTILTPLPGTELWEEKKGQVTTGDYSFFDGFHLVLPARLGAERFYERFARLCTRTEVRTQITGMALLNMLGMTTRSRGRVVRKIFGAVTEMRSPEAYSVYPGTARRPEFVPEEHGTIRKHTAGQVGRIVMKRKTGQGRTWLMLGMCLALLVPLGSGVVEAKKDKGGEKCEGTKKQRKQKMEKREISDEQFIGMVAELRQTITAEREQMKETLVSRLTRKYEEHKATGAAVRLRHPGHLRRRRQGRLRRGVLRGLGKDRVGPVCRGPSSTWSPASAPARCSRPSPISAPTRRTPARSTSTPTPSRTGSRSEG